MGGSDESSPADHLWQSVNVDISSNAQCRGLIICCPLKQPTPSFFWNKARTEIPVPPVYLYCSTPQNLVGAEYILMEVAPWGIASKLPASSISFALLPTWRTSCPHSSISWPRSVVSLRRFPAMISDLDVFVSRIRVPHQFKNPSAD